MVESGESSDTAEACFNQLLNAGKVDEEGTFWSKENSVIDATDGASVPDEDGILTAGENAWGYVRGLTMSSPTETPILFDSSKTAREFSTQVWEGKAVVVKLNGSAQMMDISPDDKPFGRIYEECDGMKMNLFK